MKKLRILIFVAILVAVATELYAQPRIDQAFALQLNTGYTYMIGKKLGVGTNTFGLGSLTSGQIPIGIELRYKLINRMLWNPNYLARMGRWSNYFTDRLYLDFGYTAALGIPYYYIQRSSNFENTYTFNLNTHTLRIGAMYDFTNNFENLLQWIFNTSSMNFKNVRTLAGIDLVLFLQKMNNRYSETLQGATPSTGTRQSNLFANFGIMPKVEVEYYFPAKAFGKGRFSQWWLNHHLYMNGAVQYTMIIPSKIKNFPLVIDQSKPAALNHSINFNVGVGIRF